MGRPKRLPDPVLAARLRSYLKERRRTVTDVAAMVGVDKATVSRALADEAFSRNLQSKIATLTQGTGSKATIATLLQESLRLLTTSDRLRQDAERLLSQALDRAAQTQ
jgi:transcriptional regulator with XRE-family HTH domain